MLLGQPVDGEGTGVVCFRSRLTLRRGMLDCVADFTRFLNAIGPGTPHAVAELLLLIFPAGKGFPWRVPLPVDESPSRANLVPEDAPRRAVSCPYPLDRPAARSR
jgi:hypothetical protein